ncbi:MAG: D-alanyl-D-alanine carboxypeptidase/D-alanyl-D-alanine-endopeptidase [Bdellovibrionales bacterium]|nr:D-alanyl-D-alanine carboxypeptidase/D-alanyl-D-alanine-endopeptidase [Bdellovibrionales bacterium]
MCLNKHAFQVALFLLCAFASLPTSAAAANPAETPTLSEALTRYLNTARKRIGGQSTIAVSVSDAKTGQEVFSYRGGEPMTPASVVKIITSAVSLKALGPDYQFPTEIFVDYLAHESAPKESGTSAKGFVGNLYVRGYGDPSLTSEALWRIVETLRLAGVRSLRNIVIDDTLFVDPPGPSGARPYEAGSSATSLNYNCYEISVGPGRVGEEAIVHLGVGAYGTLKNSAKTDARSNKLILGQQPPSETFKPSFVGNATDPIREIVMPTESIIVKGTISASQSRKTHYRTVSYPPLYLAYALREMLKQSGIKVHGKLMRGETPGTAKLLHVQESESLAVILTDLNHFSNNFIAEQLLYALGEDSVGYRRRELGLDRLRTYLESAGFEALTFSLYDGSGLDNRNRLTTNQLVRALVDMYQDFAVSPVMISSLSRFSHSGTLKKRSLRDRRGRSPEGIAGTNLADAVWGKTGTLTGVSSLAGFVRTQAGKDLAYAIIINSKIGKHASTQVEDEIVKTIIELPGI